MVRKENTYLHDCTNCTIFDITFSTVDICIYTRYALTFKKGKNLRKTFINSLREKCPNTEFLLVSIFLYSVRIQENTDQKKLRIWTHFTQ